MTAAALQRAVQVSAGGGVPTLNGMVGQAPMADRACRVRRWGVRLLRPTRTDSQLGGAGERVEHAVDPVPKARAPYERIQFDHD